MSGLAKREEETALAREGTTRASLRRVAARSVDHVVATVAEVPGLLRAVRRLVEAGAEWVEVDAERRRGDTA